MSALMFSDDPCQSKGEGITRTSNPNAKLWPYEVKFPLGQPMRGTIRAMTKNEALRFAQARHPEATAVHLLSKREAEKWAA